MSGDMVRIKLKYTFSDVDRHGNVRHYFRRRAGERRIRLYGDPGSEEFMAAYHAARIGAAPLPVKSGLDRRGAPGTIKWLCEQYFAESDDWKALDATTRRRRRTMLDRVCERIGSGPFKMLERKHVKKIRDELAPTPHGGNNLMKALSGLFNFALAEDLVDHNVVRDVKRARPASEGYHTWTDDEMRQFMQRHPLGTKPFLAIALLAFTGQRRSDIVKLGRQHRSQGFLTFTQTKNAKRKPVRLSIPVLPVLDRAIAATPSKGMTFLETEYGRPFSAAGFGNRFREWCDEAGLPHCTAHGLRKAGATIAAENGATPHQLNAIFGWTTLQQAEIYTRAANQKRLAGGAMTMLISDEKSSPKTEIEKGGEMRGKK